MFVFHIIQKNLMPSNLSCNVLYSELPLLVEKVLSKRYTLNLTEVMMTFLHALYYTWHRADHLWVSGAHESSKL